MISAGRWIEEATCWPVRKLVRTARHYRTIKIQAGARAMTAAGAPPDDLREALDRIHRYIGGH
ncbi:MAG TPA: hypothetical protein VGS06_41465 [Streptosporangiaceae bacterium]|nr:hypothetical protein [Streptosporangiaceae bacterium]